jgi:hypothetical protein
MLLSLLLSLLPEKEEWNKHTQTEIQLEFFVQNNELYQKGNRFRLRLTKNRAAVADFLHW